MTNVITADSTWTDLRTADQIIRGHTVRRLTIGVLALLVLLGGLGVFGMRSGSVHAAGAGYQLTVEYGVVSRAGLDTPWRVTGPASGRVRRPDHAGHHRGVFRHVRDPGA